MAEHPKVAFIGLGNLGAPMAQRLVDWPGGLIVFDVRPDATTSFADGRVQVADALADVAVADVISVMVLNDEQVRHVVARLAPRAKRGTVIAIHSTIDHRTAVELAAELEPNGIHVIDAPVSGGVEAVKTGDLAVMVGAEREVYERVKPTFKQWASMVVHAGEPGAGTRMKLARNMLTFTSFAAACEAMKLAELAGLDVQAFSRVVRHTDAHSGGTGAMMFRDDMSKPLAPDHFLYQPFLHTRDLGEKDLSLALGLGGEVGVDLPLAKIALQNLAEGLGVPRTSATESR
ncbi:NAD(P)-dependent oxidoreductase [Mycobacterium simiae]|uniref:NAD(P)-dependent oxidoreductase n=1 Tax=Mycobacterium simiae TaxID=1784 RepID=UPI0003FEF654|nr:NAD(P)-dependent oxidoreductase [Mycobacterium simiae]PLV54891.1 oxidoreductase [Mycobacterium tuberculosis variant microti OV254]BBX41984.1 oxidoreductase [Mycobacterium simiae]